MFVVLIRSLILYILVIFAVRLMGKRQLGELQPSELVITILISNIATLPLEDVNVPVIVGVTPILALVCFEVLMSGLTLKFPKFRRLVSGSPKIIIHNGVVDQKVMNELRFSIDDLVSAMRGKDVFDISEVQFAIVETNGSFSVMKKREDDVPKLSDIGIYPQNSDPPQLIVADGKMIAPAIAFLGSSTEAVKKVLAGIGLKLENVMIMTADSDGKCYIAKKNGGSPHIIEGAKL